MFKRVLVPLDGSMLAELALEPALILARQATGTVYIMRVPVYSDSGAQTSSEYHRDWATDNVMPEMEGTSAYLREIRSRITQPDIAIRTIVGEGDRAEAIIDTAVLKDVDLIAMASHTRSGLSRWLLGSTAGKVIRQAQTPILLIRQPVEIKHILITLDGSDLGECIIETALALAAGYKSRITFLQVHDGSEEDPKSEAAITIDSEQNISGEETYLDGIISRHEQSGIKMEAIMVKGPVADSILSYAARNEVDLIAMSTNGRSGLRKLIFGSVTEKVMCDSGCAMLIVRPVEQDVS